MGEGSSWCAAEQAPEDVLATALETDLPSALGAATSSWDGAAVVDQVELDFQVVQLRLRVRSFPTLAHR